MNGWEPREVTDHVYDSGRLVRSVTRREPEFSHRDKVALLAVVEYDADLGSHGFPLSETTDPANERAFIADKLPTVDFAAKAIGDSRDAYYKAWPDVSTNGHLWGASRAPK